MAPSSRRFEGTIASWNQDRGFGFIKPASGGPQVFVHVRALPHGSRIPEVGDELSYEIERIEDGKTRARFVRLVQPWAAAHSCRA